MLDVVDAVLEASVDGIKYGVVVPPERPRAICVDEAVRPRPVAVFDEIGAPCMATLSTYAFVAPSVGLVGVARLVILLVFKLSVVPSMALPFKLTVPENTLVFVHVFTELRSDDVAEFIYD